MAYTLDFTLNLGATYTGRTSTLRAQLYNTSGATVGSVISTGFAEVGSVGNYIWHYASFPDDHRGAVRFTDTGESAIDILLAVNPEEAEYTNTKLSTLAAAAATAVWAAGTRTLTSFGTLVADIWANITRTITGGTISTVSDKSGYALSSNQTFNNTGQSTNLPADVKIVTAGAITAAAIATDAIDSDAIAASAVTELQSGLATSANLALVKAVTDKLDTMLQADGDDYQYTAAALEQASGSTGDGDVAVNHDTPTANAMLITDWAGNGIDGATVRAYLTSEYATSANSATVRGTTRTNSAGEWIAPLMLDDGVSYTIVVTSADGDLLPGTTTVTP